MTRQLLGAGYGSSDESSDDMQSASDPKVDLVARSSTSATSSHSSPGSVTRPPSSTNNPLISYGSDSDSEEDMSAEYSRPPNTWNDLPPSPKVAPRREVQDKIADWMADSSFNFNLKLRALKVFRNPRILGHTTDVFNIKQYGTNFPRTFSPSPEDTYKKIFESQENQLKARRDRKRREGQLDLGGSVILHPSKRAGLVMQHKRRKKAKAKKRSRTNDLKSKIRKSELTVTLEKKLKMLR